MYNVGDGIYTFTETGGYISMFMVTGEGVIAVESVSTSSATALLDAIRYDTFLRQAQHCLTNEY